MKLGWLGMAARLLLGFAAANALLLAAIFAVPVAQRFGGGLPAPAEAIVVLGAGLDNQHIMSEATARRTARGVALMQEGLAPLIVMSQAGHEGSPFSGADHMAAMAYEAGLPETAVILEPKAGSTLQNGLYAFEVLREKLGHAPGRVIIVTSDYHLLRSWASFRWAGFRQVALAQPACCDRHPGSGMVRTYLRELSAFWLNAARALVWPVARHFFDEDFLR